MCGATSQQKGIEAQQSAFMSQQMAQYQVDFQENQAVLGALTKSLEPIVNAGPDQLGFSENERNALNTSAEEGAGEAFRQAQTATNTALAAKGGGNMPVTSGAADQVNANIATGVENNLANERTNIIKADYATGRQNYQMATGALMQAPGAMESPLAGTAQAANTAGKDAMDSANAIQKAGNSWMGLVGGALGAATSFATGGLSSLGGMASGGEGGGIFDSNGGYLGE